MIYVCRGFPTVPMRTRRRESSFWVESSARSNQQSPMGRGVGEGVGRKLGTKRVGRAARHGPLGWASGCVA